MAVAVVVVAALAMLMADEHEANEDSTNREGEEGGSAKAGALSQRVHLSSTGTA